MTNDNNRASSMTNDNNRESGMTNGQRMAMTEPVL